MAIKRVFFYLIDVAQSEKDALSTLAPHETLACQHILENWKERPILVLCEHQQQAEIIDEQLWTQSLANFVPHNLITEAPPNYSPVEIGWVGQHHSTPHRLLVNLSTQYVPTMAVFTHIIDYVPPTELLKSLARERYKQYKNAEFNIKTTSTSMT